MVLKRQSYTLPELREAKWRKTVFNRDPAAVRELVAKTGVFTEEECEIAAEMVDERLVRGANCDYAFCFCEYGGRLICYAAYGKTAGTEHTFDLYWIAVDPLAHGKGFAQALLEKVEKSVRDHGGRFLIAETSTTEPYARARAFYDEAGFDVVATIADFYRFDDGKVIYRLALPPPESEGPAKQETSRVTKVE